MNSVSEEIVREYLELSEFSVKKQRKFLLKGSRREEFDEVDFIASNLCQIGETPKKILLGKKEIRGLERAVIAVRPWHSETFSLSRLKSSPEIFNLALLNDKKISDKFFRGQTFHRILVIPSLPQESSVKEKVLKTIHEKGLDYTIEFKTILEELVDHVEINRNYSESPILEEMRILKRYDLFKDYQMELFKNSRS